MNVASWVITGFPLLIWKAPEATRRVWNSGLLMVAVEGARLMAPVLVAARLLHMPTFAAAIANAVLYVLIRGWESRGQIQAEMQRGD
jgi:hypothetical protein